MSDRVVIFTAFAILGTILIIAGHGEVVAVAIFFLFCALMMDLI